jgi:hypothetical protein
MVQVFLFLALFVHRALGSDYAIECLNGIRTAVSEFAFVDNENGTYWTGICNDTLGVYSLWAAAKIYCTPEEIIAGSNMLGEYCEEYGGVPLTPYATLLPNLTDAYINSLQVVDYADIDESIVWNNSVLLSKDLFTSARRTTVSCHHQSRPRFDMSANNYEVRICKPIRDTPNIWVCNSCRVRPRIFQES